MLIARLGTSHWTANQVFAVATAFFDSTPAELFRHRLAGALSELGYTQPLYLVNRASTGLTLALTAMRKKNPARHSVIVPAYCSPSVPSAVHAAGLEPIAAPVTPDLNLDLEGLGPLLREDVVAVVGAHMYALPLDISKLKRDASLKGVFVVDDAAHVMGIGAPHALLGTAGDVGLLSFNQSKTLTGGSPNGGGALIVSNDDLRADIEAEYASLPEGIKRPLNYLWFALNDAIEILPRPLPSYVGPLRPLARALQQWCGAVAQSPEKMCAPAAAAVLSLVPRLPDIIERKKRLTAKYLSAIGLYDNLTPVQPQDSQYLSRFIVRWTTGVPAATIRELLARRGVSSRLPYPRWAPEADPSSSMIDAIRATHLELPGALRLADGHATDEILFLLDQCCRPALPAASVVQLSTARKKIALKPAVSVREKALDRQQQAIRSP